MPRPCKKRKIRGSPNSNYFKPAGIKMSDLKESVLTIEEFEAIRLVDLNQASQKEAAEMMDISQPTLSRLLKEARQKISDSIVNGKALRIN